jgi:glutathione S-transferase
LKPLEKDNRFCQLQLFVAGPFSQRVLLTLEEKAIPYNATFIDIENKPQCFLEANPAGKVPVMKEGDKFVADSDVITQLLEEKFPEPSLKTPEEYASVGAKLFPAFVAVLKSHKSSDGTKEALLAEFKALDEHFKVNKPFVAGEKLTGVDLALAPKLYHATIALPYYRNWSIPQEFTSLLSYIEAITLRKSFKKTAASAEFIIAGWDKHDGVTRLA